MRLRTSWIRVALETLVRGGVEFIVIGGVAATAHGSSQLTNCRFASGRSAYAWTYRR